MHPFFTPQCFTSSSSSSSTSQLSTSGENYSTIKGRRQKIDTIDSFSRSGRNGACTKETSALSSSSSSVSSTSLTTFLTKDTESQREQKIKKENCTKRADTTTQDGNSNEEWSFFNEGTATGTSTGFYTATTNATNTTATTATSTTNSNDDAASYISVVPFNLSSPVQLSWRLNPILSFSDWTIEVHSIDGHQKRKKEFYHVHRTVLAFGPRRCGYFAHLFQYYATTNSSSTNKSKRQSILEWKEPAAVAFGDLLDYVYGSPSFEIVTTNAVALRFLSQCLSVPCLQKQVDEFITRDLTVSNAGTYLSQAWSLQDATTSCRVVDKCLEEGLQSLVMATSKVSPSRTLLLTATKINNSTSNEGHNDDDDDGHENRVESIWKLLTQFPTHIVEGRRRRRKTQDKMDSIQYEKTNRPSF